MAIERIPYKGQMLLPAKIDLVFKALMVASGDLELLASLLSCILDLDIRAESITVRNSELVTAHEDDKLSRVDVRVSLTDGKQINIEIQLENEHNIERRSLFYLSRLYTDQMTPNMKFAAICPAIAINILDFELLPFEEYHNRYRMKNLKLDHELTDAFQIDFIELPKIPGSAGNSLKELWMRFLAAKTEDELDMLANKHPMMDKAVRKLEYVSADPDLRYALDMREKAILDYNSAMITKFDDGIEKGIDIGRREIVKNMLRRNKPLQEIAADTGLTLAEVDALRAAERNPK